MRLPLPTPALFAVLTVVYFAAGKLGLSFATLHSSASAVWPPTGIAIAAFLLFGPRAWPAIFAGAFLAGTVGTSLGIAAGNTLEGLVAAYLLDRFASGAACFERARDVFRFAAVAAVATTVSATLGVASLALGGLAAGGELAAIWLTWWLGDATGALLVTPFLLLWYAQPRPLLPADRPGEAVATLVAVAGVAVACFAAPVLRDYPLMFLCLPPLAWMALRFGPREVATANVLLAAIAVMATERATGPLAMATRNESLLVLQAFMGMVAMTLLPMAAVVREHRRAVEEARAATRARDVFLAMLSHELRNPLQAIAASLGLLEQAASAPEQSARAVAIARRQSEHLTGLLNDLLDVARAVSGKVQLQLRPTRLDETARHCIDALRGSDRLGRRILTLETQPVTVDGDAGRLQQIVANLLANAIKFTAPGGSVHVVVHAEDGQAVLRVRDDGIGIAPDLLPNVFELFTQGERQLDRREGGLGIGLTLVRTLAELQGGTAQASSGGEGRGSEFTVRFPLARHGAEVDRTPADAAGRLEPCRVLVVEDNADAREALVAVLAAEGHAVWEAVDGEAGIEVALRERPDVVLVDIGLPRLDGYEVARRLRERAATVGARWGLVALTGYGQPEDVQRAEDAGFDAHLVKPVFPEGLRQVVQRVRGADRAAASSEGSGAASSVTRASGA